MSFAKGVSDLGGVIKRILGEEPELACAECGETPSTCTCGWRNCEGCDQERQELQANAPYPWCHGNPTIQDCIEAGYCRRNPSCGD